MRWMTLLLVVAVARLGAHQTERETETGTGFRWGPALRQSLLFVSVEHGGRLFQKKTRREFRGKFWKDYWDSVKGVGGWGDGDSWVTNYLAHPVQGAVAGYIQIQNDPGGVTQEFSLSRAYWKSRAKALGWSAAYSTQFELGLLSEATIGNVGKLPRTAGYTDLVMTPLPGLGMIVAEDAVDRYLVRRLEQRIASENWRRFFRSILNPQRSLANLLRVKPPWHRDTL